MKYTGSTWIAEGTLELVGISSLRNSSGVRVDGVLDVSQTADGVNDINGTPGGTAIKPLTSTGQVVTGAHNLQVNEDGTDFSGKSAVRANWFCSREHQSYPERVISAVGLNPMAAGWRWDIQRRVGLAAAYESDWTVADGRVSRSSLYGIANLYYDFSDRNEVSIFDVGLSNEADPFWG